MRAVSDARTGLFRGILPGNRKFFCFRYIAHITGKWPWLAGNRPGHSRKGVFLCPGPLLLGVFFLGLKSFCFMHVPLFPGPPVFFKASGEY